MLTLEEKDLIARLAMRHVLAAVESLETEIGDDLTQLTSLLSYLIRVELPRCLAASEAFGARDFAPRMLNDFIDMYLAVAGYAMVLEARPGFFERYLDSLRSGGMPDAMVEQLRRKHEASMEQRTEHAYRPDIEKQMTQWIDRLNKGESDASE